MTSQLVGRLGSLVHRLPQGRAMTWAILDQMLVKGSMFLFGLLAARLLGLEGFGRLTIILVVVYLLQEMHGVFVTSPMMTIVGKRARSSRYFAALMAVNAGVATIAALLVGLIVWSLFTLRDGMDAMALGAAASAVGFAQSFQVGLRRMLFARKRESAAFCLDLIYTAILIAGLALTFVGLAWTSETLLWLMAAAALLSSLPFLWGIIDHTPSWRLMKTITARHWAMARWLLSTALVTIGQEQAVWLIMGFTLGDAIVGSVRIGHYLYGLIAIPLTAMHNYVVRHAAEVHAAGRETALVAYLWRETLILGGIVSGLLALIVVPGSWWLHTLFGVSDETSLMVLRAFGAIYVAIFLRELWIFYLRTVNRTADSFAAMAISSAMAAALAYPATIWFGAAGAVAVIGAAHLVSMALIMAAVQRHLSSEAPHTARAITARCGRLLRPLAR